MYQLTNGRQQVLPLDSIFKKTLPEWNKYAQQQLCIVYMCMSMMPVRTACTCITNCCRLLSLLLSMAGFDTCSGCVFCRPLPHERIRQGWRPSGDPVYARTCLVFPKHEQHCRVGKLTHPPALQAHVHTVVMRMHAITSCKQLACSWFSCVDV